MPLIRSVATALPPYEMSQQLARDMARAHFLAAFPEIDRYLPVFDHAQIDTRYLAVPPEWFLETHSFKECNDIYIRAAVDLGETAARRCLEQAGLQPTDIDHVMFVSTTGLAAPSPDAMIINRLHMNSHTRRTPIWGLGCAGGVAGLSRAYEYARGFPEHRVLLITVELCSVTLQLNDLSKRNLIAVSLFSDGASALLIEGDTVRSTGEQSGPSPQIMATQSTLWPDTHEIMGWDIIDSGMQVVFSARIPGLVQRMMRDNVNELLAQHNLVLDDIDHWILHPGGAKVVSAYEASLGIDPERLTHTRNVLRNYGNMSSSTVFFVLEEFLKNGALQPGEHGILAVLGPGFSCELALVRG